MLVALVQWQAYSPYFGDAVERMKVKAGNKRRARREAAAARAASRASSQGAAEHAHHEPADAHHVVLDHMPASPANQELKTILQAS